MDPTMRYSLCLLFLGLTTATASAQQEFEIYPGVVSFCSRGSFKFGPGVTSVPTLNRAWLLATARPISLEDSPRLAEGCGTFVSPRGLHPGPTGQVGARVAPQHCPTGHAPRANA